MLHAQLQAARVCLEEVAQALARQAITQKSLFLAHHHEHLCRQAYFLYKEHAARWYVEAQQAAGVAISTLRVFFFLIRQPLSDVSGLA